MPIILFIFFELIISFTICSFAQVNEILTQKKEETNNLKSECTLQDLELRSTLTDTRTNLALVHAEMAKVRAEYEAKCKELNK